VGKDPRRLSTGRSHYDPTVVPLTPLASEEGLRRDREKQAALVTLYRRSLGSGSEGAGDGEGDVSA